MAIDVVIKIDSTKDHRLGTSVVLVNAAGAKIKKNEQRLTNGQSENEMFNKLTDRFDDPTYYG